MSRLYVRRGDQGSTALAGQSVLKSHYRINAIGEVDECSAVIGMVVAHCTYDSGEEKFLRSIQADLFVVSAILGGCDEVVIDDNRIAFLEERIDQMSADLDPVQSYLLPGGCSDASWCFYARAVIRRTERAIVAVKELDNNIPQELLVYMNRLSDLFFLLARKSNDDGKNDVLWEKDYPLQKL